MECLWLSLGINTGTQETGILGMQENEKLVNKFNFNIKLLGYISIGFELICISVIIVLFIFAWYFDDRQSLIIPTFLVFIVLPLLEQVRRLIAKGNVSLAVLKSCYICWLSALCVGFFSSIVPVIFAASAILSFVPVIIATTTTTHSTLLKLTAVSTIVCCICGVLLVIPPFLSQGVPAEVIAILIAVFVPVLLCISSISLWYGNRRMQLSLIEAQQVNEALAQQHRLEIELKEQKRLEEKARHDAERADLEKLRYQLNPHFLFNSLTSIRGAIRTDTAAAREMLTVLAEFCRLTLIRGSANVHTLSEELDSLRLYLKIEQVRSGDNLQVRYAIDETLEGFLLPAFILQPLVENALKYGRQTSPAKLQVIIEITSILDQGIYIHVSNTGSWLTPEKDRSVSTRTGLHNLYQRLFHHYGDKTRLDHSQKNGWVHVGVQLPYSLKNNDKKNKIEGEN